MVDVLHLTPHLNSGLGSVLLSTLKEARRGEGTVHRIVVYDGSAPIPPLFADFCEQIVVSDDPGVIAARIAEADVVQMEWWNHPLIYKFLFGFPFPPARLAVCGHVGGWERPQVLNRSVIDFADLFIVTSKATARHPLFDGVDKLRTAAFPVDVDRLAGVGPKPHDGFNVGYIGTLDYSKMHRGFLRMSAAVGVKDACFIVCGNDLGRALEREAQDYPGTKFRFMGLLNDIRPALEIMDVFGYPLNSQHFGTGEQAILEAMYASVPVVAFSGRAEREIVVHNETGILVDSEADYIAAIEYLHDNPEERRRMGRNGRRFIESNLLPEQAFGALNALYLDMMRAPKRMRRFVGSHPEIDVGSLADPDIGAKLFIESLGAHGEEFCISYLRHPASEIARAEEKIAAAEINLRTPTKGSLFQYLYFYPNDPYLNYWGALMRQREGDAEAAARMFSIAAQGGLPATIAADRPASVAGRVNIGARH